MYDILSIERKTVMKTEDESGHDLTITRIFDAPRELVWKAWTEPERAKHWWGPRSFTAPFAEMDVREGGSYLLAMRSPEGDDFWSTGVYREIVPMERIVATDSFADEQGNVVPATYYGMGSDIPLELLTIVTFKDQDGKTKMTLIHRGFPPGEHRDNAREGWSESFDKLAEYLASISDERMMEERTVFTAEPGEREVVITRAVNAPCEAVFEAMTNPTRIPQWWGPKSLTTTVDKMDVKPGGTWRFIQQDAQGNEYAFSGEYREVVYPERLVQTFHFEPEPDQESLDTLMCEVQDGKTKVTAHSVFSTVEVRDKALQEGMEEGARETWDRLAELVEELSEE
jgi:uncharacterized protein YndB with AHSA1/START domain